ncbi:single-stranded-DNA-specific exonuclease RecJ [Virgibacillus xinjiangensis]|uniref:Single-stranded-DNA-specific exonuclease RecJ n=1 Tax=Virgibacillus xinjiangensis TaxID=393090 RepID=A0ABV7CSA7_9BACI
MLQSKANWKLMEIQGDMDMWMDDSMKISPVVRELLLQRGITTAEEAVDFLSPNLENLHNPLNFDSITEACARVYRAVENQEKILVYGDYDADGVCSTTVMLKALRELGADCDFYIPNRFTEGYGPNEDAFKEAYKNGFKLIITVDNGIAGVNEAEVLKQLGVDLIITDHHEVQAELPETYAILHPKCSPNYPFQELAGVGVAFKFAQQLLGYFPEHLLPFTAIGTIADLVPLVDENRILAYYGLRQLSETANPGLKALKSVSNIEGNVTEEDVGFLIGPRINAVGRLQDADLAVQLLMTEDHVEAAEIAAEIDRINQERQKIVNQIAKEAENMTNRDHGVLIVAKEGWNEGVLGIVASKLVRKFDRPAIVLAVKPETGEVKGSARSIPSFDLFRNCMKIREYFTHFGGHSQAAGMTFPLENLPIVQEELDRLIAEQLSEEDFKQEIEISRELALAEIDEELVQEISRLAPFGMKNPKPVFQLKEMPADARQIGSAKNHLKLQFEREMHQVEAIGFGMGDRFARLSPGSPVTVAGELGINEWNGKRKVQLVMRDMKVDEWQLFDYRGKRRREMVPCMDGKNPLVIGNSGGLLSSDIKEIGYEQDVSGLPKADVLYIFELPESLGQLEDVIRKVQPENICVCYHIEQSLYLSSFPTREEFKWLYGLILKRKILNQDQDMTAITRAKGWDLKRIRFMLQVFSELDFVKMDNGSIKVNENPEKKDLKNSPSYRYRMERSNIEKKLYYSNFDELKRWFDQCMDDVGRPKEEKTYGL